MGLTIGFGMLGTKLDAGKDADRWKHWRPTVSLFQHEDLLIDRYHLLTEEPFLSLAAEVAEDIRLASPETEVLVEVLSFRKDPWDLANVYGALEEWATRQRFSPERDDHLIHITTGTHIAQISLFLLHEAGVIPGRLIQTAPPFGRARRGVPQVGRYSFIDLELARYDAVKSRHVQNEWEASDFLKSGIATRNPSFNRMIDRIEQVALRSRAPILLMGPTGAGKSQLARRIYELRHERGGLEGEFVEVNCATLRGDTAASTLFGHRKGAFTGARSDRAGLLRSADGGLLFLDEIGELGLDEQAMLLRALEEKRFLPVGSDKVVESDFQLMAGTNRDLRQAVVDGQFREDLLARIQLWSFTLPSLRERREDIEPNLDYELAKLSRSEGRAITMNKEARTAFLKFAESSAATWQGNFRDLNAAMMRMATLAPKGRIRREEVSEEIERLQEGWLEPGDFSGEVELSDVFEGEALAAIDPFDRVQIAHVIKVCRESRTLSEAGRVLFSASRARKKNPNDADRVRKFLAKWDLEFSQL
ncbi:MAG: RNA repair transcriptional activator RtcR [Verrucomicrobiota bacterium JB023]|nr:RNA repair transcriptional activator RtcR [Verrucomicrobiota bacterium JB023]